MLTFVNLFRNMTFIPQISKLAELKDHVQAIYALEYESSQSVLFSAGADRMIVQRNIHEAEGKSVLAQATSVVYSLCFIPAQNLMLIGQRDGVVHFINITEKRLLKSLKIAEKEIFSVKHIENTEDILICTGEGKVIRCSYTDYAVKSVSSATDKSARCLAFHPSKNEFAVGYSDNCIRIFDFSFKPLLTIDAHASSVFSLAYSTDGKLFSGSRDAHMKVWSSDGYVLQEDVIPHLFTVNDIQFHHQKNIFATASRDKSIRIWDAGTLKLLKTIDKDKADAHSHSVNKLLWLHDSDILVSAGDDSKIFLWKV